MKSEEVTLKMIIMQVVEEYVQQPSENLSEVRILQKKIWKCLPLEDKLQTVFL